MAKKPLCPLGLAIRRRLDEKCETQEWLVRQVRQDTGKYFDGRYLHKILTGEIATRTMVESIGRVLGLEEEANGTAG